MNKNPINLLLADDDADDRMFFNDALDELPIAASLRTVNDGEQLMRLFKKEPEYHPDILFLDLNMPRKNGFDCLVEIKSNEKLNKLPVIIYSTSFDHEVVSLLYEKGAHHYIRKPGDFTKLKKAIHEAIIKIAKNKSVRQSKEKFVIQV